MREDIELMGGPPLGKTLGSLKSSDLFGAKQKPLALEPFSLYLIPYPFQVNKLNNNAPFFLFRGVIFVVDSANFPREIRDVAE